MFLFDSKSYSQGKNRVYLIAFLHVVLMCFGIWSLTDEMIDYQEPVTYYEGIYIGLHYSVHVILIICLVVGTFINLPFFLLPWLGAAFVTFSIVTVLTLVNLKDIHIRLYSILIILLNFLCIGLYWFCWYTVFSYFMSTYKKAAKIHKMST